MCSCDNFLFRAPVENHKPQNRMALGYLEVWVSPRFHKTLWLCGFLGFRDEVKMLNPTALRVLRSWDKYLATGSPFIAPV